MKLLETTENTNRDQKKRDFNILDYIKLSSTRWLLGDSTSSNYSRFTTTDIPTPLLDYHPDKEVLKLKINMLI